MNIDLKGRWHGEYIYGPSYGEELEGCTGEFVMYVDEVTSKGFSGKVIETDGDDEFHTSALKGFLHNNFINFIKRFEKYRYFDENLETAEDESSGYEVIYEGSYDTDTSLFKGEWEIRNDLTPLATEEGLEQFWSGTWWMRKVDS